LQIVDMSAQNKTAAYPAELGSLDEEVASDVALLRQFMTDRERLFGKLFGRTLRRSAARDEILRLIILAFSKGQLLRASAYVRQCAHYATGPSIRREIDVLVDADLVLLKPDPSHRTAHLIIPTKKLIDFYNREMPRLRDEIKIVFSNDRSFVTRGSRKL
jgi:hypothetical protein